MANDHRVMGPDVTSSERAPGGAPSETGADLAAYVRLDPRVIALWRLRHLVGSGFLFLLALIGGVGLGAAAPRLWLWVFAGWTALFCFRLWHFFWYPPRRFEAWGYRIDGNVLEIKRGIWFRVLQLLPLSRLQHADLNRGPFERHFGLSSLVLYTAGTHEAALVIPGLEMNEAVRLRDQLVARGGDDAV